MSDSLRPDSIPPGSSVHRILQARILEWVAIPFPWDLPNPRIELVSLALNADSLLSEAPGKYKEGSFKTESVSHSVMSDSLQSYGL